jgi:hypothetical protein
VDCVRAIHESKRISAYAENNSSADFQLTTDHQASM